MAQAAETLQAFLQKRPSLMVIALADGPLYLPEELPGDHYLIAHGTTECQALFTIHLCRRVVAEKLSDHSQPMKGIVDAPGIIQGSTGGKILLMIGPGGPGIPLMKR